MSVLFPAPLGPMMAVKRPDWKCPWTHLRIVLKDFFSLPSGTEYESSENSISTGGRLGRCVRVTMGRFRPLGLLLCTFLARARLLIVPFPFVCKPPLHRLF